MPRAESLRRYETRHTFLHAATATDPYLESVRWLSCPVCGMGVFSAARRGPATPRLLDACRQEAYRRRLDTTPKPWNPPSTAEVSGSR